MKHSTCFVSVAPLVLSAAFTVSCDHARVEESATEEIRLDLDSARVIEVRVDDGRVDVVAGESGVVEIRFHKQARAAEAAGARSLLENVQTEAINAGDVIRVSAQSGPAGVLTLGGGAWTDVELRIPREGMELDIRTDDGGITVVGVSGSLDLVSGDGRVRLESVTGRGRVRAYDGSVTGTELAGDFDVVSEDGRIRLEGSFGRLRAVTSDGSVRVIGHEMTSIAERWNIHTSDGAVEVALPVNIDARIEASTADGRIDNELSHFDGFHDRRRVKGTIGESNDTELIVITTMDGRIVLRDS